MPRFWLQWCAVFALSLFPSASILADEQIELVTAERTVVGKPLTHNQHMTWIVQPAGNFEVVLLQDVKSLRKVEESFFPESAVSMRKRLQRELGTAYEVVIQGDFVVAGPPGRAPLYADLLDRMARAFRKYTSVRSLPVHAVEFPLNVQVFTDKSAFDEYCRSDGVAVSELMKGYYNPMTNRIALFEELDPEILRSGDQRRSRLTIADLETWTVRTLIHEGIHQLAFNVGLHSRIGRTPRWVVEGLAETMEGDSSMNQSVARTSPVTEQSRLAHFKEYQAKSRSGTIAEFITNDERLFATEILNAYSEAWALSHFLAETRPRNYASYLKRIAVRDPLDQDYSAAERLSDFQAEFGNDIPLLESQFLRYIDAMKAE